MMIVCRVDMHLAVRRWPSSCEMRIKRVSMLIDDHTIAIAITPGFEDLPNIMETFFCNVLWQRRTDDFASAHTAVVTFSRAE